MKNKWFIGGVITILSILIGILVTSLSCDNYIDVDSDDDDDDDFDEEEYLEWL
jgi:hypothetical protein